MKKTISCLLCLTLLMTFIPKAIVRVSAWDGHVLPDITNVYEKYNPLQGEKWLSNQTKIEKLVTDATNAISEDDSIYTIAKDSIIFKIDEPTAYAKGYKSYIDENDSTNCVFSEKDTIFVPLKYTLENIDVEFEWNADNQTATVTGANMIELTVGKTEMIVNGEKIHMDAAPLLRGNTLFVPVVGFFEHLEKKSLTNSAGFSITPSISDFVIFSSDINFFATFTCSSKSSLIPAPPTNRGFPICYR